MNDITVKHALLLPGIYQYVFQYVFGVMNEMFSFPFKKWKQKKISPV